MTDRDAASTPEPDGIPREPSKHELDEALKRTSEPTADDPAATPSPTGRASKAESSGEARGDAAAQDADLQWPEGKDDEPVAPLKHAPSRAAVIAGGVLAALLLGLAILGMTQNIDATLKQYNSQQIEGVAKIFSDEKSAKDKGYKYISYSKDEITAAQKAWKEGGEGREMTSENLATTLNVAKPDSVTKGDVDTLLKKYKGNFVTKETLESQKRSTVILFAVTGALMALGTAFYQRGKAWARFIGMFVGGFIAVMYIMQIVQGALNIPGMVISLAAVAAFYFFMKGRLEDPPARAAGAGGGGFGGFGSLFQPRGPRKKPTE